MLSLSFSIPSLNTINPLKPKLFHSQSTRNQTHLFSPLSISKLRKVLATTATDVAFKEEDLSPETDEFPAGLRREMMPRHVAVIMDGNVRWARQRGLPQMSGHEAGVRSLKELVELFYKWGIRVLSVFAFSCDNWIRLR